MKKKLFVLVLGALSALLLLEAGLRLFGAFETREGSPRISNDARADILCLGDSFTFGLGASPLQSYPAQLRKLLETAPGAPSLAIKGFPGENSSEILAKTAGILDTVQPKTAIVLLGVSNLWNLRGFHDFQSGRARKTAFLHHFKIYRLQSYLKEHLRLEKLGQADESGLTVLDREQAADYADEPAATSDAASPDTLLKAARAHIRAGRYDAAIALLNKALEKTTDKADLYSALADAYQNSSRPREAEEMLSKAIALQPKRHEFYTALGRLYAEIEQWEKSSASFDKAQALEQKDFDLYAARGEALKHRAESMKASNSKIPPKAMKLYALAIENLSRAAELAPAQAGSCYSDMADIYLLLGEQGKALKALKDGVDAAPSYRYNHARLANLYRERGEYAAAVRFFTPRAGSHPIAGDIAAAFASGPQMQDRILDWIASDLRQIISLCRQRHIQVVLMNYPRSFDPAPSGGELNRLYASIARENKLTFINNYAAFEEAIKRNPARREQLLGRDMHCTAAGYQLMADNVFSALRGLGLIR